MHFLKLICCFFFCFLIFGNEIYFSVIQKKKFKWAIVKLPGCSKTWAFLLKRPVQLNPKKESKNLSGLTQAAVSGSLGVFRDKFLVVSVIVVVECRQRANFDFFFDLRRLFLFIEELVRETSHLHQKFTLIWFQSFVSLASFRSRKFRFCAFVFFLVFFCVLIADIQPKRWIQANKPKRTSESPSILSKCLTFENMTLKSWMLLGLVRIPIWNILKDYFLVEKQI